ncbi:MAG: hypothetical protein AAF587_09000 [Bacteroidota bacterium]
MEADIHNTKLINDPDDLTIRDTQDIQDILGHPPSWILRTGISVMFLIVTGLILLSTIMRYPDTIQAEVQIGSGENQSISTFYAYCELPLHALEKIEIGAHVRIHLDGFPYQTYGVLSSKVDSLPTDPTLLHDKSLVYILNFPLSSPLESSHKKIIPSFEGMTGMAFIVTEDRSLFDRVFAQLYQLFEE